MWPAEDGNAKVEEEAQQDDKGREVDVEGEPQAEGLGKVWRGRNWEEEDEGRKLCR